MISKGFETETEILLKQLKFIKKNIMLVMDKGYYSMMLARKLKENGTYFLFRMKKSSNFVKDLKPDQKSKFVKIKYDDGDEIKCKLIKYTINNKNYYLLTNYLDENIDFYAVKNIVINSNSDIWISIF